MNNLKWAVVHFYVYEQDLQCSILREDFDSPKEAERWRSHYLMQWSMLNPQEFSVVQYVN